MKRLSIDIDGVVADYLPSLLFEINKRFNKNIHSYMICSVPLEVSFNISHKELNEIIEYHYRNEEFVKLMEIKDSRKYINKLYDKGFKINFVTSRRPKLRKQTEKWLRRHKIKYHNLIMGKFDKGQYISELNTDIFIDDEPLHIFKVGVNHNVKCFLFCAEHNRFCLEFKDTKYYKKVKSWKEIYKLLAGEVSGE